MFIFETVITEKCNLGCKYCYMNNNPTTMEMPTFQILLDKLNILQDLYHFDEYHLDYFGGEPLLNFKLIEQTVPLLKQDSRCKSFSIISNLLELDDYKIDFIKSNNITVSFSFDGLWNEYNRPLRNGKSSLSLYEKKKDIIKQVAGKHCKTMVSPASLGTLVANIKYLVSDWGLTSPDLTIVRDDIWTDDDVEHFREEIRDVSNLQIEYIKDNKPVMIGFYQLYLLDMFIGYKYNKRDTGCFAGKKGMAYMPNGICYPCARFGTNREYPIYDLVNGIIYKDNYNMFIDYKFHNPKFFDDCLNCVYYQGCNAGCTYSQMKNDNRPIKNVCKLFDILYNESFYVFNQLKYNKQFIGMLTSKLKEI